MKPKIRWTKKDKDEFARLRKNFNAKVTRLEQSRDDLSGLIPERIYMEDIVTRDDFNKMKKRVSDFTQRGSEEIVSYKGQQIPKYEKKQVERMVKSINMKKFHKRKLLSYEGATMGLIKDNELKPINLNKERTEDEWKKFLKSMEQKYFDKHVNENLSKYKENYIKGLRNALGGHAEEIIQLLQKAEPSIMLKAQYMDEINSIDFIYDPYVEGGLKTESIYNAWADLLGEPHYVN